MKQLKPILLLFSIAVLLAGNIMAQENDRAKRDLEFRQFIPSQEVILGNYCIPGGDCSYNDGFTDFAFAGIENYASGCSPNGYGDFTTMQGTAEIGDTYTANMETGYDDNRASMWIDFNDDAVFSDYERILTDFVMEDAGVMYNVDITIPGFATPGIHRMRIGAAWAEPSSPDPCAILEYGEWEDYMIEITGTPIDYDASTISIDLPGVMLTGDITPLATVANLGVKTISFPVTMNEPTTGYSSTVQVNDLAMGESVQVSFDTWTVGVGTYNLEACTDLSGDQVPSNDCANKDITFSTQPRQKLVVDFFTGTW